MKLSLPKKFTTLRTQLSTLNSQLSTREGFTLIELLVVIGIIGILAAALLQTIDPFEQLKKGRDTIKRDASIEYLNANVRYYAAHSAFPWSNLVANCTNAGNAAPSNLQLSNPNMFPCTDALVADGELKTQFRPATAASKTDAAIWVTYLAPPANSLVICFSPESKSFINDKNTKYTSAGVDISAGGTCTAYGGNVACFQCVQ